MLDKLSQKVFWQILDWLPTEDIVFALCYVSINIYKAIKLYPLAIDRIKGEDMQYLDIGWFESNAKIFSMNWSVRSFAFQIEPDDSVSKLFECFFESVQAEDVKEIFIDDLRALRYKKKKIKNLHLESHFSGLSKFPHLKRLSFVNVPFFAADVTQVEVQQTLSNLEYVKFWSCEVEGFFDLFNHFKYLQELCIVYVDIKNLTFLKDAYDIRILEISSCGDLTSLEGIQILSKLEKININWCTKLVDVSNLSLCSQLREAFIDHCDWVVDLSALGIPSITDLKIEALNTENSNFLAGMSELKKLSINFCPFNEDPFDLGNQESLPFRKLEEVRLLWFNRSLFEGLDRVVFCQLYECSAFETLEDLKQMRSLTRLELKRCDNLKTLEGIEFCKNLRYLFIAACFKLDDIYSLNECQVLEKVVFRRLVVPQLSNFPLEPNHCIREVGYIFCSDMLTIDCISNFKALRVLEMDNCTALMDFSPIGKHETIEKLTMRGMSQPGLPPIWPILGVNLRHLTIRVCATVEEVVPCSDNESLLTDFELGQCYSFDNFDFLLNAEHLARVTLVRCYDKLDELLEDKLTSRGVNVKRVGVSNKIRLQVQRELARLQNISIEDASEVDHQMSV